MMLRQRRGFAMQAGFTLFELVVSILLLSVLAGKLFGRVHDYQEAAEKAAMEQTAGALRSALNIQSAALIASGRSEDIPKLLTINPFDLLTEKQKNYAGEIFHVEEGDVEPGKWFFDMKKKEVVYLVSRSEYFSAPGGGPKEIRFKVELVYNELGVGDGKKRLGGVTLKEVRPYSWNPK